MNQFFITGSKKAYLRAYFVRDRCETLDSKTKNSKRIFAYLLDKSTLLAGYGESFDPTKYLKPGLSL
jgi:hypothetical protein